MKQLCPSCLKSVEVPESAAGTDYPCLVCGSMIPVPKNYSPSVAVPPPPVAPVDRPPPPPGLAPPAAPVPPPASAAAGETGITVPTSALDWLPPICLSLALVLTFFTWVGSYPGGHRLFAQNAWDAILADHSPNSVPTELEDVEKKLDDSIRTSWFLIPYLVLLFVALFFAWIDKLLPDEISPTSVPGPLVWLTKIWPSRRRLLLVLCAALLVLFVVQRWKGFGLENTLHENAVAKYEAETKAADTDLKKTAARVKVGMEYSKFAVQTTTWLVLAFMAHVVCVVALILRRRADDRAGRPSPRVALRY